MSTKDTSSKTFKRTDLLYAVPTDLTIITDEKHALYDPRVKLPIQQGLKKSIKKRGIIKPIVVRREGSDLIVIDGRRRVRHAIEANKELKADGVPESEWIRVPFVVRRSDDVEAMSTMVELNELNAADELGTKIEKATRLLERGLTEDEVADSFGVTSTTIKSWLKLKECHPKVREAVAARRLNMTDAVSKVSKLEYDKQVAAMEELAEANPTRETRKQRGEKARKTVTPVTRLRKVAEARESLGIDCRTLIDWIMGDATKTSLEERFPKLVEAIGK